MILTEKTLRRIIREEFERFMEVPRMTDDTIIESPTGAAIIMPNPVREAFDEGRITSIGDIL